MKLTLTFLCSIVLIAQPNPDPYVSLNASEKKLLKPAIERWIHDQIKHDWFDLWNLQDQTPQLKNELLLGRRDAPNMTQNEYVQAMKETIGTGYPEIKAFTLREVSMEKDGFRVLGCASEQREAWKQVSLTNVHVRLVNGRPMFGLPDGTSEPCKL